MSTPSADAFLESAPSESIAALAKLYDRFAHALDPFSKQRDEAERVFMQDIADLYDRLPQPKPPFRDFRKAIIVRCKKHLAATNKPAAI
jgi:hypothetical protein